MEQPQSPQGRPPEIDNMAKGLAIMKKIAATCLEISELKKAGHVEVAEVRRGEVSDLARQLEDLKNIIREERNVLEQAIHLLNNSDLKELLKLCGKLRSLGVPDEAIAEVVAMATKRIREGKRAGIDTGSVLWPLTYDIVLSYIDKGRSEGEKRMFRIYSERIAKLGLTREEHQLAFYIICDLGNEQIGDIIGRSKEAVRERVKKLRKKLGIPPAGSNDRLNAFRTILGLK
jgi:hypothetical protein